MGGTGGTAGGTGEAERFARLLRELKERSGLSYGTLARKLHTSTSTLHRYCRGEALPAEFAAVARFARACGATPSEALELHRAWLLADARRRAMPRADRERVPEGAAPAESAAGLAVEPAAERAVKPGSASDRAPVPGSALDPADRPMRAEAPVSTGAEVPLPMPAGTSGAGQGSTVRAGSAPGPSPTSAMPGAGAPAGRSEPSPAPGADRAEDVAPVGAETAADIRRGTRTEPAPGPPAADSGSADADPGTSGEADRGAGPGPVPGAVPERDPGDPSVERAAAGTAVDVAGPGVDPWPGRATVPAGEPAGERFPASEQGADEGATAEATLGAEPRSALGAVPDAGSASAPGQAPAEGGSERGTGPAPGAGSGGEPEPAIALTTGTDAGSVRGDSWYRGRRAVAGAVVGVAAVALAATALAVAGPLGRDGADRAAGTGTTTSSPRAGASGGADDPRPPAPTTGPSQGTGGTQSSTTGPGPGPGPGTSASASGGPVPGRTPGASTAPAPGPNTSSPASGSAPRLRAAVRSHVWANGCDHAYLIDRNPGSVPAPPVEADAPGWAAAQGAVHAGQQIVEATLHGTGSEAIVVQGIDVRVTARRTPLPWNVHLMSPGCGGALTPASFTVNLDAPRPVARPAAGHDGEHPVPAPAFPLRVSATDPVVLRIEAAASGCDCEWYGEVRWTGPAGPGLTRIDDNGRPLRTSASGGRPQYGYAAELGRWSRG